VAGRGPGPHRRAGAMMKLTAHRGGRSRRLEIGYNFLASLTPAGHDLYNAKPENNLFIKLTNQSKLAKSKQPNLPILILNAKDLIISDFPCTAPILQSHHDKKIK